MIFNGKDIGFVYIIEAIPKDKWDNLLMGKRSFNYGEDDKIKEIIKNVKMLKRLVPEGLDGL